MHKMKTIISGIIATVGFLFISCQSSSNDELWTISENMNEKIVVYQVFTRLFGNKMDNNKPWGTKEENGVGKFSDFTPTALKAIKELGVTHIWYTGIPHHALVGDYTEYGISLDDPDVIKGRAGSPYAVKDYYNVNPDLADDPARRLEEFRSLVNRSHRSGLKVIIDIVPNHVARRYESHSPPDDVVDFGADDDTTVVYDVNNNFYYSPGQAFQVPQWENGYQPLGGEKHPLADGKFHEFPAKWTGNGSRSVRPHQNDWYETVKINYGVDPNGRKDFDLLPDEYRNKNHEEHLAFWKDKVVPDSWIKFKAIALFWLSHGVDGFRYDMAEMVPVEFWSFMNSAIKSHKPDAFLLAEVYNPQLYRDYIHLGKMDFLYDKVQLYDTLKVIMQGQSSTDRIVEIIEDLSDIEAHMLHFLENHDEQRIASPDFAGDPFKAKPAMVVSALSTSSPTMIYFGQEVGEPGAESAGFGWPSRTSIFDYVGVPLHQRWMNNGKFDGGLLSESEKNLRNFYQTLLNLSLYNKAFTGSFLDLHRHNRYNTPGYDERLYSFARWYNDDRVLVISNFSSDKTYDIQFSIHRQLLDKWGLSEGSYIMKDLLNLNQSHNMSVQSGLGIVQIHLDPLESKVLLLE